jgi:peptidoglycan/LPS O-acetylase OafA/YrhL
MYVFLPFLFMWIRGKRSAVWHLCVLWVISVFVAIGRTQLAAHGAPVGLVARVSLLEYVPNFLPGVIAFTLMHIPRIKSYLWPPFVFLLIGAYAVNPHPAMGWTLCLLLGFAIPFFSEIKAEWLRAISNRIATYSYGIYLSHQFCIWFVDDILSGFPLWSRVVVLVAMLVGIPVVLYHWIEKPMMRAGVALAEKWEPRERLVAAGAPS